MDALQRARKGPRQGGCGSKEPKKARPDGATSPSHPRLWLDSCPTAHPCAGVRPARSLAQSFGYSAKALRCSGAPYGARHSVRGLALLALPNSIGFQPRRRASVEERPKSSPTGHRKDSVRAHPAQGCAVCAPPEADRDARDRRSRRAFRGKMALVTFPERKVTRGCRGRSAPLVAFNQLKLRNSRRALTTFCRYCRVSS